MFIQLCLYSDVVVVCSGANRCSCIAICIVHHDIVFRTLLEMLVSWLVELRVYIDTLGVFLVVWPSTTEVEHCIICQCGGSRAGQGILHTSHLKVSCSWHDSVPLSSR